MRVSGKEMQQECIVPYGFMSLRLLTSLIIPCPQDFHSSR
jgi:hypothetical protein